MFADISLAARIERADARILTNVVDAVRRRRPEEALVRPIAGGVAAYAGASAPMNKMAGLGFGGAVNDSELDEIEQAFRERGTPVQIELSTLADPALATQLTRRGYRLVGFENVLGRTLVERDAAGSPARPEEIDVSRCGHEELETWIDVMATGFLSPDAQGVASHESFARDALERVYREIQDAAGFLRFIARRRGLAAGAGAMFIADDVALLSGAATLPGHRRRGVQTALLAWRLQSAAAQGCDLAVMTTLPGSKSQENAQRRGFSLLYSRAILVRSA